MCDDFNGLFSIQPWRTLEVYKELATQLKQDTELPDYITSIALSTALYEDKIRELWEEFKGNPTKVTATLLVDALKDVSGELWTKTMAEILDIDLEDLTEEQLELLGIELEKHHDFYVFSLLPDLLDNIEEGKLNFDNFDYRVVYLYAGALWSFGMLSTVMFDGLDVRDLTSLFQFVGPNDKETCTGPRGCQQHVDEIYMVYQILKDDIIPGRLKCLTSCRHILFPV